MRRLDMREPAVAATRCATQMIDSYLTCVTVGAPAP
jgi:hypothetical protein